MKKFNFIRFVILLITLTFFSTNSDLHAVKKTKAKATKSVQPSLQDFYKKVKGEVVVKKKKILKKEKPSITEQELKKKTELTLSGEASVMSSAFIRWIRSKKTKADIGMTEEEKKEELEKKRREAEKIRQKLLKNFSKKYPGLINKLKKAGISEKRLSDLQTKKIATNLDIINLQKEMVESDLKEMNLLLKMVAGDEEIDEARLATKGYEIKSVDVFDVIASDLRKKINNLNGAMKVLDDSAKEFEKEQSKLRFGIETKKMEVRESKIKKQRKLQERKLKKSQGTKIADKIKDTLKPVTKKIKKSLAPKKKTITVEDEQEVKKTAVERLIDLEEEQVSLKAFIEKNNTEIEKTKKESEGLMKMVDSFRNGIFERELKIEDAENQGNIEKVGALKEEIMVLRIQEEKASKMFNEAENKQASLKKTIQESDARLKQIEKDVEQVKKDKIVEGYRNNINSLKEQLKKIDEDIIKKQKRRAISITGMERKAFTNEIQKLRTQGKRYKEMLAEDEERLKELAPTPPPSLKEDPREKAKKEKEEELYKESMQRLEDLLGGLDKPLRGGEAAGG